MIHSQHHVPGNDSFRCSHGQQSLWLIDQISPGSAAYNLHAAIRTPFTLQPTPLAAATAALIDRHETLRTVFDWDGFEPVQRVLRRGPPCLQRADLQDLSGNDAEAELMRLSREAAATPFDLGQAPLLRLGLVQMPGEKSVLLVTIHHIVADAWSLNILLRDLLELYIAEVTGRSPNLPGLPIQYVDFAAWQRDLVDLERNAALVEGWRNYLAGTSELDVPTDHPRPSAHAHGGDRFRFRFSEKLSKTCMARCREFAATPYALITGCFAEVLHRHGGGDDFMIGMPTAGRPRPDLEDLIGFFVRTLVLRIDLKGQPTFRELVQRISASVAEALALQDLPFEQIVELIEPDRDLAVNPLFQVTSQFLFNPLERADGGSAEIVDQHRGFANFDLTLDFWEEDGTIAGQLEYASALFKPATIKRLVTHITLLLEAALESPDVPLAALDMLSPTERATILGDWSTGNLDVSTDQDIVSLFSQIAARHPDKPALRDASGDMSYAELDRDARALAKHLLGRGLAQGARVGLGLPRGRDQIVAALGILMAGGAYVALDPAWPEDRIGQILATAGIDMVVAMRDSGPWAAFDVEVIAPLEAGAETDFHPDRPLADSIAYVAFTSGSTGAPKGVPALHRAVIRLMRGGAPFEFAPGEVMLGFAPLGFDASTFEIWGPLLGGACLAIAPDGPLSPHELADFMTGAGVTKAWLTAGLFSQMSAARPDLLARMDAVFAGGDALSEPAVRNVLKRGGTVINGYGPTENTVFTCYSVMKGRAAVDGGIRIGRPVPGTWIYVLDELDRPVPVGICGELVAGGLGISPGYLGDHPDNLRFTDDPIYPERGPVYRTGDLVRWTEDGALVFLGRRDRQVKIRGFRVEPAEIEKAIQCHAAINDCCVAVRGSDADDKALIAFVVFADGQEDVAGLRRALARQLPPQSRPSFIMAVPQMPLGENGKIDMAALLAMDLTTDNADGHSDTLTEIEDIVAEYFADILGLPSVPVDQPFFDLGGHSLHATRVVTRLRELLDVDLPLQAIFEEPTVRGLAARLEDLLLTEFESEGAD